MEAHVLVILSRAGQINKIVSKDFCTVCIFIMRSHTLAWPMLYSSRIHRSWCFVSCINVSCIIIVILIILSSVNHILYSDESFSLGFREIFGTLSFKGNLACCCCYWRGFFSISSSPFMAKYTVDHTLYVCNTSVFKLARRSQELVINLQLKLKLIKTNIGSRLAPASQHC